MVRLSLLILLYLISADAPVPSDPSQWWEVSLVMTVDGEYSRLLEAGSEAGTYSFKVRWAGSMERDNGDYILYQGGSTPLFYQMSEQTGASESPVKPRVVPVVAVQYVVRKDQRLHFDVFTTMEPTVTGSASQFVQPFLPRSAEHQLTQPGFRYNRWIESGSNRISIVETLLYRQEMSRGDYHWVWRYGDVGFRHTHRVSLALEIRRKREDSQN